MAILHPFKAHKPSSENVKDVACVPYDVISADEARAMAEDKENSFLHVIRPEIDLPEGTAFNNDAVYRKGKENLDELIENEVLIQDQERAVYIYRLTWQGRTQTGIFGCVSVDDYNNEVILKHELTRPDKEDDRTRHILTQSAHAEPVMMTYKDSAEIDEEVERVIGQNTSLFDFTAEDGVRHEIWKISETQDLEKAFEKVSHLYIADGHHRCKSASRAAEKLRKKNPDHTGEEEYNFFPAVLFPMSQMEILAYNRVVFSIPDDFIRQLNKKFEIAKNAAPTPQEKGRVSIYTGDSWKEIQLPKPKNPTSVEKLDVHRLQRYLLEPMLGITDPRRDKNISFVGGIRGTEELEKLVDSGKAELAISMYPTSIEELVEVSDEGQLMPPKSTWFEPKLRSGLIVHTF
ncbi:MAG: DUF1015 family protein [Balneolaceae bacterium]|nr:DUF1015 family protein [Balneolaceae bacterium]